MLFSYYGDLPHRIVAVAFRHCSLKLRQILDNHMTITLYSCFKFCFQISASEETGGMIKACKTDSEGKVVEG